MRLITISSCILIATLLSCQKDKNDCHYDIKFSQIDTSLYISYKIDGQAYRYFQCYSFGSRTSLAPLFTEDKTDTASYCGYHYSFGSSKDPNAWTNPDASITIWNKYEYYSPFTELSVLIKDNYRFTSPKENPKISDTAYLSGVSLTDWHLGYSIISVMDYYKYDYDTIYNHVLKGSYFKVTSVVPVCNNFKLIEGEFETYLMNSPTNGVELPKLISLKEGKIRFIAY